MSGVRMTIEVKVTGTDNDEAVEEAMFARYSSPWHDIEGDIWRALRDAGVPVEDVDVDTIAYWAD